MPKRPNLSPGEKAEVVLMFLRREDTAARLARRHGISEQTLYRYRDQFLAAWKAGLTGNVEAQKRIQQLEQEVEERERVIGELTTANRIPRRRSEGYR